MFGSAGAGAYVWGVDPGRKAGTSTTEQAAYRPSRGRIPCSFYARVPSSKLVVTCTLARRDVVVRSLEWLENDQTWEGLSRARNHVFSEFGDKHIRDIYLGTYI